MYTRLEEEIILAAHVEGFGAVMGYPYQFIILL